MCENPGGAEAQQQNGHKEDHQHGNGKPAPEQNAAFVPVDLAGLGGLDLCQLGQMGAIGIRKAAAKVIALRLEVGHVDVGGGEIQVSGGQLTADFGGIRGAAVFTQGHPLFLGNQIEEGIMDGGDGEPFIISGAGAKVFVSGAFADGILYKGINVLQQKSEFLFDGFVIVPLFCRSAEKRDVNAAACCHKIRTGEAFGIKRGGIGRKWGRNRRIVGHWIWVVLHGNTSRVIL